MSVTPKNIRNSFSATVSYCPICDKKSEMGGKYCSPKCREAARRQRKVTRSALSAAIKLGYSITFDSGELCQVTIPDYLSDLYPQNQDRFYVFSRHDIKNEELYFLDIRAIFAMNVGSAAWRGILYSENRPSVVASIEQVVYKSYCEASASNGINGFTCSACKRTMLKSGIAASDCAGKCYRCCSLVHPF